MKRVMVALLSVLFLLVLAGSVSATTYSEIEPNDSFSEAQYFAVSDGSIFLGNALLDNQNDFFSFFGTTGDFVTIAMNVVGGSQAGVKDPYLELFDSSETLIAEDDDNGPSWNALISMTLGYTGLYYIHAHDFGFFNDEYHYNLEIGGLTPYTNGESPVPEPGTLLLLGCGMVGLVFFRKRKK